MPNQHSPASRAKARVSVSYLIAALRTTCGRPPACDRRRRHYCICGNAGASRSVLLPMHSDSPATPSLIGPWKQEGASPHVERLKAAAAHLAVAGATGAAPRATRAPAELASAGPACVLRAEGVGPATSLRRRAVWPHPSCAVSPRRTPRIDPSYESSPCSSSCSTRRCAGSTWGAAAIRPIS